MLAILEGDFSTRSPFHIDMLPTEILCMIFDHFSHLSPSGREQIPPIILLSHISRHWRHVALGAPALWDKLDIYTIRRPDVLRTFLARSNQKSLSIRIDWPQTIFWSGDVIPDFDETCRALVEQLPRIRSLSLTALNYTLREFTDKVLVNVALPHLQQLELVSCNEASLMILGPFRFNPHVFAFLRVERTMIQVKDGSCLSGLRIFSLSQAPLTYLDERQVPSPSFWAVPANWHDLPTPSLSRLFHLRIHAPLLHPVPGRNPPTVNTQGQTIPPLPFAPSFRTDVLRSVTLSSLSLSKMPYQVEANSEVIGRLFRIISMAELVEMHLVDMRDQAIDGFLQALNMHHCRFVHLRVLKLTGVPLEDIFKYSEVVGLENFRVLFSIAFPTLVDVHLGRLDPAPLVKMLDKIVVWPMLQRVVYEGRILNVRLPDRL